MKLSLLQEHLLKALQDVAKFVPGKPQIPILQCVLIRAEAGEIQLSATDLGVSVRVGCGGKVEVAGECAVPARTFLEYLSTLPAGVLEIELQNGELRVRGGRSNTTFQCMSSKEFPPLPTTEGELVSLPKEVFVELVEKGGMAASMEESRPVFASLFWEVGEQELSVVSTDGYRLSRKKTSFSGWKPQSFLTPAKTMKEISRILSRAKEKNVSLGILPSGAFAVITKNEQFFCRLVEGVFPPYQNILPKEFAVRFHVQRQDLLAALKTVLVFSRDSSGVVRFKQVVDSWLLSASSATLGVSEASVPLVLQQGEESAIAFNGRYLTDVLASLTAETLLFEMNESLKPGMFTIDGDSSFLYLVMPFRT